ncbi:MAG: L-threonylcarbamoyladenylate synthase [Ornithinimicrobium sp.]
MARFYDIHPQDPQPRLIGQVTQVLRSGGLVAYPTDACYALGAQLGNADAKQRIIDIRKLDDKHHFTLICHNFAQMGQFVQLDNAVFRAVKAAIPGPYTFILPATPEVPKKVLHPKKKTIGVRIPDHRITQALLTELGEPMLSSTLLMPGQDEPLAMGWEIKEELDLLVDAVIDGDETGSDPTTVVDFSAGYPEIVRVGAGDPTPFE